MSAVSQPSLRELLAAPVEISVGGVALQVKPMGWYQAANAVEHLLPIIGTLPIGASDSDEVSPDTRWIAAVTSGRDQVLAFCAAATPFPVEELRELSPAHIAELLMGLVELNADFFVQSLPRLAQRGKALAAKLNPASASSTSSSA